MNIRSRHRAIRIVVLAAIATLLTSATGTAAMRHTPTALNVADSMPASSAPLPPHVLDLAVASFGQRDQQLQLTIFQHGASSLSDVVADGRRSLCAYAQAGRAHAQRWCIVGRRGAARVVHADMVGSTPRNAAVIGEATIRLHRRALIVAIPMARVDLPIGPFHWWIDYHAARAGTCAATVEACDDRLPDTGSAPSRIFRSVQRGCTPTGPWEVRKLAAARRKVVALTFDDGPWTLTPQFLAMLQAKGVRATFFLIGRQVPGNAQVVRDVLAGGNAIGNHSWSHPSLAAGGGAALHQISATNSAIARATGYTPCLLRPPFGASSRILVHDVHRIGMETVEWNVDTEDWLVPKVPRITTRAISATRPGSIILMHDGGGNRSSSLVAAALVIDRLRSMGYSFETVPNLLGYATTWQYTRR